MSSISNSKGISNSISKTHSINTNLFGGISVSDPESGISANIGGSIGYGYSWGKTKTTSITKTKTTGINSSISLGANEGNTFTYKSYLASNVITKLEETMNRIKTSQASGLWKYATYVLAENSVVSKNVANFLRSTSQGDKSFIEPAVIQEWSYSTYENSPFNELRKYISYFTHPVFMANDAEIPVTPTAYVGTNELSDVIAFPKQSLAGLPVIECAAFGRNVSVVELDSDTNSKEQNNGQKEQIKLGKIFHMNHEEKLLVELDANSLTSHVFITGSTGAGKSNTVYQILNEVKLREKKFLVIEPAKGEYKDVFGGYSDVAVYGTNPTKTEMLKINPFSFPKESHILEHLDRLIEIFNVCWPMYAAMPAVLKEAVEKSYEDAGWDLVESKNKYSPSFYPTFADVMRNVREIIDSSDYDKENKGAYKGSLVTRLKSLTNGLNGMIFVSDDTDCFGKEIGDKNSIFEKNAIIDLSRVGSQETKSLLMGLLVLKLQEYRMAERDKNPALNSELRHITVLEEAHNLLKRTSTEQSSESANLAGKSVEMISNAIAEMRTYGEGFIIADQAPGLLDMAAIRNTNTKIIMRLPDMSDRELVGKAANLNDDQITELAKLPRGVAAVYQNEWVQSVLCKVDKFTDGKEFLFKVDEDKKEDEIERRIKIATMLSKGEGRSKEDALKELCDLNISGVAKLKAVEILMNPPNEPKITKLGPIMSALFPKVYSCAEKTYNENKDKPNSWSEYIRQSLPAEIGKSDNEIIVNYIIQSVLHNYVVDKIHDSERFAKWYAEPNLGGAK